MNSPAVSIVMGVYNDERFLAEAIESILSQTFGNFEFIICDDGSSDKSLDIIKYYQSKDDRIVLLQNSINLGLAASLNRCIEYSKGKYIARMDSDDRSLRDRLEKQFNYLENNSDVAVVGTQAYFIDQSGKRFKKFNRSGELAFQDVVKQNNLIHPSTMIRKAVLIEVSGYSVNNLTKRAEDYDLWCKISEKGYRLNNLKERLFEYREDITAYKKRKYKFRIDEFRIKAYWIRRANLSRINYLYAIKPLLVGLIPSWIMIKRKIKSNI